MNNPNPFIPQGSLLEQKNRKRTRFQVAVFAVIAVNLLVITPMLIQGCKRDASTDSTQNQTTTDNSAQTPPPSTNNDTAAPLAAPGSNIVSAPTAPPPPPPATTTEYVILKGDTLDAIHRKFSVSVKAIMEANPGLVATKLQPGHKIQIPAATAATPTGSPTVATDGSEVYVVKPGDTLGKIATAHGTTYKAIETLNNLKTTKIKAGDKLKMPPPKAVAAPPPAIPAATPASTTPTPTPPPTGTP